MENYKLESSDYEVEPPDINNELCIDVDTESEGTTSIYLTKKDIKEMLKLFEMKEKG